jgi:hypothetical protein
VGLYQLVCVADAYCFLHFVCFLFGPKLYWEHLVVIHVLGPMLSIFTNIISLHKEIHIGEFIRKFFRRQLSAVNYGKKSVVDNIGPWSGCLTMKLNTTILDILFKEETAYFNHITRLRFTRLVCKFNPGCITPRSKPIYR